jgi:hypothetical protein
LLNLRVTSLNKTVGKTLKQQALHKQRAFVYFKLKSLVHHQQQAASLLQVLKDIDLLGVICAIAANNFAITVDQVSTHIPRQTLTAIM